ncbi:hypothetical protein FNYG_12852 [Fusarium nygamai]|uniref:Zonadhesin n=1 Tax=Gibberella nygamai TaxID=42673 RepID=A0A2K0VV60_GIBNY|nr:hypothetical protein FNYG_12852 [Fusarium nygamai]
MTGSRLQMIMDERSIYNKELETTGGKFQEVKSEKTTISDHPNVEMVQSSGEKPVALTVRGLSLVKAERSAISVKEPTISAKEPTISAKEPTVPVKEPTISAKEPTVPAKEPTVPVKEPTVPAKEPTVPAKEPTIPVKKPTILTEEPTVPGVPTIPAEEPTIPTEEPTIPAEATQTESAQQTTDSSRRSRTGGDKESGSHVSVSNLESETVTGTATTLILPTTSGPVEITPNEGTDFAPQAELV